MQRKKPVAAVLLYALCTPIAVGDLSVFKKRHFTAEQFTNAAGDWYVPAAIQLTVEYGLPIEKALLNYGWPVIVKCICVRRSQVRFGF